MTEERMALIAPVEKQADGDLGRERLAFAAGRIMHEASGAVEGRPGPVGHCVGPTAAGETGCSIPHR